MTLNPLYILETANLAFGLMYPEEKIPALNVPKMTVPPKIDRVIGPKEWRESVKVMGVVSTHSLGYKDRPVSFRVAWGSGWGNLVTRIRRH